MKPKPKPVSKSRPSVNSAPKEEKRGAELDDAELAKVSGGKRGKGKVRLNDFSFVHQSDKASPLL